MPLELNWTALPVFKGQYSVIAKTELIAACDAVINYYMKLANDAQNVICAYPYRTPKGDFISPPYTPHAHIHLTDVEKKILGVSEDKISVQDLRKLNDLPKPLSRREAWRHFWNPEILKARRSLISSLTSIWPHPRHDMTAKEAVDKALHDAHAAQDRLKHYEKYGKPDCEDARDLKNILGACGSDNVVVPTLTLARALTTLTSLIEDRCLTSAGVFTNLGDICDPKGQKNLQMILYPVATDSQKNPILAALDNTVGEVTRGQFVEAVGEACAVAYFDYPLAQLRAVLVAAKLTK